MYVDDHIEIHKIRLRTGKEQKKHDILEQIKKLLELMFHAQKKVGAESGEEKSIILLELHGNGSQSVRIELGGKIMMEDGRQVKKYLGVRIGGKTESNEQELDQRIRKAS